MKKNQKEEKRFAKQSKKHDALLARGKKADWKVIPADVVDPKIVREQICRIITELIDHYKAEIAEEKHVNFREKALEIVDFLKGKASEVVYRVTPAMAKAKAIKLMDEVGIPEPHKRYKQYPFEFSGGMRQRIVIAIALAANPDILICDEPTTALDVTIQAQILELMMELKDKLGMAIIMITHDLGIVASMCDRIAVMYAGRIVETGTCDEIFYHPKHEYTKGLLESIPRLDSTKHEKLIPIEGNPVDLLNPPEGCEFAPRCKNCMKICLRENPPRTDFSETHYAHCFMNQKAEMEGGNTNE